MHITTHAKQKPISTLTPLVFHERGFTFVETLVAIAVLLLAIVAPLTLVYQSLSASRVARNQVTAIYLAQEAVEFIRATRDENALQGDSWLDGLEDCTGSKACYIDIPAATVDSCTGDCPILTYDPDTYLYGYGGTKGLVDTVFTRSVSISEIRADAEVLVEATVTWMEGSVPRQVTLGEYIYNWE